MEWSGMVWSGVVEWSGERSGVFDGGVGMVEGMVERDG